MYYAVGYAAGVHLCTAPGQALRGDGYHSASEILVSSGLVVVRFFALFSPPPPPLPFFFFTFVTFIASGVLGRGSSASRSYAGNRDGGIGAADDAPPPSPASTRDGVAERDLLPFLYPAEAPVGRCGCGAIGTGAAGTVTDAVPWGISPVLSMMNVWAGGAGLLRRLGRRAVGGAAVCVCVCVCVHTREGRIMRIIDNRDRAPKR